MSRLGRVLLPLAAITLLATAADARKRGITGQPAPEWSVDTWVNLASGATAPTLADARGEVVVLFFFQSWCPGCHSRGFPTLRALQERYGDRVLFVAIQTVFEGYGTNTAKEALSSALEHGVDVPVGHDGGPHRSRTMARYRSGGTPWFVIIDRQGIVRFDGFRIPVSKASALLERLLKAPAQK